jgi:hypothetical protein
MKKFILILALFAVTLIVAGQVHAEDVAGKSATIAAGQTEDTPITLVTGTERVKQKIAMKRVLERYGSPLAETVDGFMAACTKYDIDCYLLPSIAGVESGFGKAYTSSTYNVFGWGRGTLPFTSFEDGYMTVAKGLRENYINRGATSVEAIGAIYCEGNTWSGKVNFFMAEFKAEEQNVSLYLE